MLLTFCYCGRAAFLSDQLSLLEATFIKVGFIDMAAVEPKQMLAVETKLKKHPKGTTKLSKHDYSLICSWLEVPENRQKLEGVEKKVKVGSRPPVKSKAFQELAHYLNENQKKGSTLKELTSPSLKTRFKHYFNRYRAVKEESEKTGFGLIEEDRTLGIETVEEKLERMSFSGWMRYMVRGRTPLHLPPLKVD